MSLTSLLRDNKSFLRHFFEKCTDKNGVRECIKLLNPDKKTSLLPNFQRRESYSLAGLATDYLIHYSLNNNKLILSSTTAEDAIRASENRYKKHPDELSQAYYDRSQYLYNIAKTGLNGSIPIEVESIRAATALAILDIIGRVGWASVPLILEDELINGFTETEKTTINTYIGDNISQKTNNYVFDRFIDAFDGDRYIKDVSNIINLFIQNRNNSQHHISQSEMIVSSKTLSNSTLVGGADIDCVLKLKDHIILTDIKTSIKGLGSYHIQQLIGYALLHDQDKDKFQVNSIGIYHSRTGELKYISLKEALELLFGLGSIIDIRKIFMHYLKSNQNPYNSPPFKFNTSPLSVGQSAPRETARPGVRKILLKR